MKKMWKRVLAIATAMLILAGMLPTAVMGAAEDGPQVAPKILGSVTINKTEPIVGSETPKPVPGAEFSFYKILSVTAPDEPGVYAEWELANELYKETVGNPDDLGNYDAKALEAKYANLQKIVEDNKIEPTAVVTTDKDGQAKASSLPLGWYLVLETKVPAGYIAGRPFMVAVPSTDNYNDPDNEKPGTEWVYDIVVQPKNQAATIDKAIVVDNATTSSDTVGVGDVVNYQLNTTMPTYDDSYDEASLVFKINDTMSAGLTLNNSISVSIGGAAAALGTDYTMEAKENLTDNKTFEIIFKSATIAGNMGAPVVVNYSATVNENAVVGEAGNTNTARIVFENAPGSSTSGSSSIIKVYTFDIQLNKKGESNAALAGAEFKIYSDAECKTEVTNVTGKDTNGKFISDKDGKISFGKLDAGTYYLKEVKSPAGYTLLANPIKIEIIAGLTNNKPDGSCTFKIDDELQTGTIRNGIVPVNVVNHKGFTLPTTGGMGTYLFTIGGLILMAGAVILLVAMKKKKA